MADTNIKTEVISEPGETAMTPEMAPAPRPTDATAAEAARPRIGSAPKRLSKGQRKHLRRLKQAGEAKIIDRRRS
jgi:hypothetical protein